MRKTLKIFKLMFTDKMKAFIIISSSDDNVNSFFRGTCSFLNENGITYSINVELLNIIINQRLFNQCGGRRYISVDGTWKSRVVFNVR